MTAFSQPTLSYKKVITSLSVPVEIVSSPDGSNRLFVVQKLGLIKVFDKSYNFLGDFVKVSNITTSGERGLLSLAFHPDYKNLLHQYARRY
jgi:glucose/arabinose dehydrogenase